MLNIFNHKPKESIYDKPVRFKVYDPHYQKNFNRWNQFIHAKAKRISLDREDLVSPELSGTINWQNDMKI